MAAAGPFDRWISFELGRLNAGLVVEKKSLTRLLAEPEPECRTREGDPHPFDRAALNRLAAVLTREEADPLLAAFPDPVRGLAIARPPFLPDIPEGVPPLPPVVEGRLLSFRREDAGVLEHVERVPVFRLQDVVDDAFGVAEEVEDVLGHRPGLFLLHPGPVNRVLDRPGEVVDGQRPGRSPL